MPAGEGKLVVRGGAGDDTRAHDLAELDGRDSGAAGGAENGKRLAPLEICAFAKRIERRAIGHSQTGGALEIELVRNFDEPLQSHGNKLARRAPTAIADHAIAGRDIGHGSADALDYAGEFRAR